VNSYHIHLSTLGFHGCGKEISQICLCPFCLINTLFSGTPSPSCHSTAQKNHFLGGGTTRGLQELHRRHSSPISQVFDLLLCKKMAINFTVPEVSSPLFLLCFHFIPVHPQFILLNTLFFLSFFFLSPKISRIWPIRSLFLPINPTSNVLVR